MAKHLVVDCPECGALATYETPNWMHGIDALMLVDIDSKACRRCGARPGAAKGVLS